MKKIISLGVLFASVAACATSVQSDNTFGIMKITDATTTELVIGVPWAAVGGASDINAMNLVLPTTNGDQLYWYDAASKKFYVWTVVDGSWAVDTTTELSGGLVKDETGSTSKTLARGDAAILKRSSPGTNSDVYLYGQYTNDTAKSSTVVSPSAEDLSRLPTSVAYTMIANPDPSTDAALNVAGRFYSDSALSSSVDYDSIDLDNDKIVLSDGTTFGHDSTHGWYTWTGGSAPGDTPFIPATKDYENAKIPAGKGAWYVRNGGTALYIKW